MQEREERSKEESSGTDHRDEIVDFSLMLKSILKC